MIPVSGPTIGTSWRAAVLGVPELDAKHHESTGPMVAGSSVTVHLRQVDRLMGAVDGEAVLAHGRKVGAAGDEIHVGAALHQLGAEIAPDAP